jgi:Tc5 transposase DNA-binding domain
MAPPHQIAAIQKEGIVTIIVSAIQKNQFPSVRKATSCYDAPRSTVRARLNGIQPRLGSRSKFRLLSEIEESLLISWIYSLEQRGFPPYIIDVRRMAQTLLDQRGSNPPPKPIGTNWIYKFIKNHPELDARLTRAYDAQRAKNEDPKIISAWFQLVKDTKEAYGILDDDTYNFDEMGCAIGMIISGASKVVTVTSVGRAILIQPGDRK